MRIPPWLNVKSSSLRRRIRRMPPEQLIAWLDIAGTEMSRAATAYLRSGDRDQLAEYDRGLAVLVAMSAVWHGADAD